MSRVVSGTVVATLALVVALAAGLLTPGKVLGAYVLVLAAIALAALTRNAREASEWREQSLFEHALRPRELTTVRPPELVRMEREITLGSARVAHLESRLLPILREAAAARLSARHNVELERRPEAARRLLGDDAWELLRPDRAGAADRSASGLPLRRIRELVERLEEL
ncbi:MAG: hypothetical protein V7644_150 [Actinomycetota bacterium]